MCVRRGRYGVAPSKHGLLGRFPRTYAHTHAHTMAGEHARASEDSLSFVHGYTHTHTHTHTYTHARAHMHTHTHSHTERERESAHTHIHAHARREAACTQERERERWGESAILSAVCVGAQPTVKFPTCDASTWLLFTHRIFVGALCQQFLHTLETFCLVDCAKADGPVQGRVLQLRQHSTHT